MPTKKGAVGYGQPPEHSRFKKGVSGNPSGRPKKHASFQSDLAAELQEKLTLTENGKAQRMTKQRALIKTLTAAAIKSDMRAVHALLGCVRFFGAPAEEQTAESVDIDDLDFLEDYLRQQRAREAKSPSRPANSNTKNSSEDSA